MSANTTTSALSDIGGSQAIGDGDLEWTLWRICADLQRCQVAGLGPCRLEGVAELIRRIQRATHALLARAANEARLLASEGLGPGPEALLVGRGEVAAATVRADAARADAARTMPALGAALAAGKIGADHLDVVAGVLKKATEPEVTKLQEADTALAEAAGRLSVESFARHVHRTLARIRDALGTPRPGPKEAELRWWWGRDNMGRLAGRLTGEQYERMVNALSDEMGQLVRRTNDSPEVADGLVAPVGHDQHLAAEAMVNRLTTSGGRPGSGRAAITIVVDAETALSGPYEGGLCETETGAALSWETFNRAACDAVIRRVVVDERGLPMDVGRTQRTATPAQWAILKALYGSCAWFGCDRPLAWCQAHHVVIWDDLGDTNIDNLVPLCHQHHHLAHEGGWRLVLTEERHLEHYQPDGTLWRTSQPDRLQDCVERSARRRQRPSPTDMDTDAATAAAAAPATGSERGSDLLRPPVEDTDIVD